MHTFAQKPARPSASASTAELSHGKRAGTPRFLSSSRLHAAPGRQAGGETLQRKTDQAPAPESEIEDEEDMLQLKTDQGSAPVPDTEDEEEILQPKSSATGEATGSSGARDTSSAPGGMPRWLTRSVEAMSGEDISDVRVHHNSSEPKKINALAYTKGKDIHVGPGQERYLPHEAWHAVQQRQGRVSATIREHGVSINDDRGLEREADTMGKKALQAPSRSHRGAPDSVAARRPKSSAGASSSTVQRGLPAMWAAATASWEAASAAVATIATVGGAAAGTYIGVTPGDSGIASLILPSNQMSATDRRKLTQIAYFRIVNEYVDRYLTVHPEVREELDAADATPAPSDSGVPTDAGDTDAEAPAPAAAEPAGGGGPTGAPTASAIDDVVMQAAKNSIQLELETVLEANAVVGGGLFEFKWGEDNTRGLGYGRGSSGSAERVGVTGFLRFRNIQASVLKETLTLSSDAKKAVGSLSGEGEEMIVHRFIGGSIGGDYAWSAWQDLAVNIEGGAAQPGTAENGSAKLTVITNWYWGRWGPDSETKMQNELHVLDDGSVVITVDYQGTP